MGNCRRIECKMPRFICLFFFQVVCSVLSFAPQNSFVPRTVQQVSTISKNSLPTLSTTQVDIEAETIEEHPLLQSKREAEKKQRSLLISRLEDSRKASGKDALKAKRESEKKQRSLLKSHLAVEAKKILFRGKREAEKKQKALLTSRLETDRKVAEEAARVAAERILLLAKVEAEINQRALLANRLKAERKAAGKAARVEAEKNQRALLTSRLDVDRKVAEKAVRIEAERKAAEEAARLEAERKAAEEAARIEAERVAAAEALLKSKREAESKQKSLLINRLEREERIRAEIRKREAKIAAQKAAIVEARQQPKAPEVEKDISSRYAGIPDIGERAYQILLDLGMVGAEFQL